MKKRITWLALLALVLFASGAWAAVSPSITIRTNTLPTTKVANEEYSAPGIEFTTQLVSDDATFEAVTDTQEQFADAEPDGTTPGVFKAEALPNGTVTITGKVWKVGSIPVTLTVRAKDGEDKVIATASRTYTITSTANPPSDITLAEGESLIDLIQADGYNGLNTETFVGGEEKADEGVDVFKVTATLPVSWTTTNLPDGLTFEISKIEFSDGGSEALPAQKKEGEDASDAANDEATSLKNGGKSAEVTFKLKGKPTKARTYAFSVSVSNAGGLKKSDTHDIVVFAPAAFTTGETLPTATWGKDYSVNILATGGIGENAVTFDYGDEDTEAKLKALGLTFLDGELSGIIQKNDAAYDSGEATDALPAAKKEADPEEFKFSDKKSIEVVLKLKAKSPGVAESATTTDALPAKKQARNSDEYDDNQLDVVRTFKLPIKAAAPAIVSKDTLQATLNEALGGMSISTTTGAIEGGDNFELPLKAKGPGNFTWTIKNLPAGFTSEDKTDEDADPEYGSYVVIKLAGGAEEGLPALRKEDGEGEDPDPSSIVQALENWQISVTVTSPGGSDSLKLLASLGTAEGEKFGITQEKTALPAGVHNLTQDISGADLSDESAGALTAEDITYKGKETKGIALTAFPGPVTWKAKDLPSGFTLSVDNSYPFGTKAWLVGTYKGASKKSKQVYTITATNTVTKETSVVSNEITVYEAPKISTKSLPDLTLGKKYTAKLAVSGLDVSVDVNIEVSADEAAEESESLPALRKAEGDEEASDSGEYGDKEFKAPDGTSVLKFDSKKLTLTGTFDRFWDDDRTQSLKVTIKAKNPAYSVEADPEALPAARRDEGDDEASDSGGAGAVVTKVVELKLKPVAPAFKTSKLSDYEGTGDNVDADGTGAGHTISFTGSKPMDVKVYITSKDAVAAGIDTEEDIVCYNSAEEEETPEDGGRLPAKKADGEGEGGEGGSSAIPQFTVTPDMDSDPMTLKIGYAGDQGWAFSKLPLTVTLNNGSKTSKGTSKTFNVVVKGATPVLISGDEEMSKDVTIYCKEGAELSEMTVAVSGDNPIDLTSSIGFGKAKNGIMIEQETDDSGAKSFKISGTPTAGKETKTVITLTATNSQTKAKYSRKITIVGQMVPEITTKPAAAVKEIDLGKTISLKLAAKGTKPMWWRLEAAEDGPDPYELLPVYGLSFDTEKGMFTGKAIHPTSDDTGKIYERKTFNAFAYNEAGDSEPLAVTIGIKGAKPKLSLKAITLTLLSGDSEGGSDALPAFKREGEDDASGGTTGDRSLTSSIPYSDKNSYVSWDVVDSSKVAAPLKGIKAGNSFDATDGADKSRSVGYLDLSEVSSLTSSKPTTVKIKATNYGTEVTTNVKVTVNDPRPDFADEEHFKQIQAEEKRDVTQTMPLNVTGYSKSSKNTTLDWKISRKPSGKVSVTIKPASDQKSATLTLKVSKGLSSKDIRNKDTTDKIFHTTFAVSVTNKTTKQSSVAVISVDVRAYDDSESEFPTYDGSVETPSEGDALPADKELAENEELPLGEGTVTYGDARNESALTQAERRVLSEGGYIIAAILPEITADESGLYDLEAVSLDEAAPEGYELVWFAFPRNAEGSEDDTIAEFYDEAGAEIFAVPEGRVVVPAPWLEKDVTYAPVIAVRAPLAGDAKDSLDDAEEGDTVTENALEEATEAE